MSMEIEFPKHIIRNIIDGIRIRHYQRIKWSWHRDRKHEKERTWYQCLCRNKTKLLQLSLKEKSERRFDPWKGYLRLQKVKLKFSYDLYTAWQDAESRILKKLNQGKFFKLKDRLWIHVFRMQVQKINGRNNQKEKLFFRSEKSKVKKQIDKLKKRYRKKWMDQDSLNWNKAIIVAKWKFYDRYEKNWDEACNVLVRKMNRRMERVF